MEPESAEPRFRSRAPLTAWAILVCALVLRLYLAAQGGALYWTDEKRYPASREALDAIVTRDIAGAAHFLLSKPEHIGFRWLGLIPAAIERAAYGHNPPHARIAAGFFGLFGVAALFLVWQIARRSGASEWLAVLALAFAASSNALFFFSRHCFPYDASLACFLAAVWLGLARDSRASAFGVGLLCGSGYLIYNGYWSVGAAVLLVDVLARRASLRARVARAAIAALGLALPAAVAFGLARVAGYRLWAEALAFAGTVNQGDFGEAWRFVPSYLKITDGPLALGLAAAILAGLVHAARRRRREPWLRWCALLAVLAILWVSLCDVFPKFVPYGRTVRAAVPFLALAAAGAVGSLLATAPRRVRSLIALGCATACLGGLAMMFTPLRQVFPAEFRAQADKLAAEVRQREPDARLQLLFADYLFDHAFPPLPPGHHELLRAAHPHRYAPYLHEGYTRAQRPRYLGHDTAMRLVRLPASSPPPSPAHAGTLELRLRFPADKTGAAEPLVATGRSGAGDLLYVSYLPDRTVRLGLDHWGVPGLQSRAVALAPGDEQRLVVSLGSLFPPATDAYYRTAPQRRVLPSWLFVKLNDTVLFSQPYVFFPAAPEEVLFGRNLAGNTAADERFTGVIVARRGIEPETEGLEERTLHWPPLTGPPLPGGYLGTVEVEFTLPTVWDPGVEPLLVTGEGARADYVVLKLRGSHSIQIGYRHGHGAYRFSAPIATAAGARHRCRIQLGSLFPDAGAHPLLISVDGAATLTSGERAFPADSAHVFFGAVPTDVKGLRPRFSGLIHGARLVRDAK